VNREEVLTELDGLERDQRMAERALLSALVREGDLDVFQNALTEAGRNTGLVVPVDMDPRNVSLASILWDMLEQRDAPTVEAACKRIADEGRDISEDYVRRLWANTDSIESAFACARRLDAAASKRLALGQRVWPEALYRWFDWDEKLLYIGITNNVADRQESHSKRSSWGRFAARCAIERFPTRADVEAMERNAIRCEKPLFNHVHNDTFEARQRLVEYLVGHGHLDLLAPAVNRG
jgi:predicted GIY-YIG superfamily endonuclease